MFKALLFILRASLELQAQAPDFEWAKRAGGTEADAASRIDILTSLGCRYVLFHVIDFQSVSFRLSAYI